MTESQRPLSEPTIKDWAALQPGTVLSVVKLSPDGSEAARYPGEVVVGLDHNEWIVLHAIWTHRTIELDGLEFRTGDHILEWFSPRQPINAFAVLNAGGHLKGWYANVTHPARLDLIPNPPVLVWHDLYVDLVGLPDKSFVIRDDDELQASGLHRLDPLLHEQVLWSRSEMTRRFEQECQPFASIREVDGILARWYQLQHAE